MSRNAADKVVAGGAVVVEILEELFLNNPSATREEAATYVYRAMNRRPDGQLGRFTRIDQRRIKNMVKMVGLEQTAANMKLDVDIVNELISKRFRQAPLTISRSFNRKLKKFSRDVGDVNDSLKEVASLAKANQVRATRRSTRSRANGTSRRTTNIVN